MSVLSMVSHPAGFDYVIQDGLAGGRLYETRLRLTLWEIAEGDQSKVPTMSKQLVSNDNDAD